VAAVVQETYDRFKRDNNGKNADSFLIAQVDSKLFGIPVG